MIDAGGRGKREVAIYWGFVGCVMKEEIGIAGWVGLAQQRRKCDRLAGRLERSGASKRLQLRAAQGLVPRSWQLPHVLVHR